MTQISLWMFWDRTNIKDLSAWNRCLPGHFGMDEMSANQMFNIPSIFCLGLVVTPSFVSGIFVSQPFGHFFQSNQFLLRNIPQMVLQVPLHLHGGPPNGRTRAFTSAGVIGMWGHIILCFQGHPVTHKVFSSISGFSAFNANKSPIAAPLQLRWPKVSLDFSKYALGDNLCWVENY